MTTIRKEIRCIRERLWKDLIKVYLAEIVSTDGVASVTIAKPVDYQPMALDASYRESQPTFSLHEEEAQQLMDELWSAGLRPTEGAGSVGQLAAVQAHLQDMRTIAFQGLSLKATP